MKANLEVRNAQTLEYIRRLGRVYFILESFAQPGSRVAKVWKVNHQHEFKKYRDALDFMISEADRIGGGDCIGDENYKTAWENEIHSWDASQWDEKYDTV